MCIECVYGVPHTLLFMYMCVGLCDVFISKSPYPPLTQVSKKRNEDDAAFYSNRGAADFADKV